ncbi:MAG: tetratricopeptide repeat protein [Gallionella sp.]|jgi:tetratricopeptide (TPR) repeat protein
MSLLLDALKHAQDSQPGTAAQNSQPAQKKSHLMTYLTAGLILLSAEAMWYYYKNSKSNQNVINFQEIPAASSVSAAPPSAASEPVASSSIAEMTTALPATASGTGASVKKAWTRPLTAKKRKSAKKSSGAPPAIDALKEAYLALSEGRLEPAEQHYLDILSQQPREKNALLGMAIIAHRQQQTERAADYYRQVLREDMGNAAAAAGLVSLSAQADPVAAESQLRELIDLKPGAAEFHYALGNVLARQERIGEAQQSYFRAYSLAPGNTLYTYNLAVALDRLHQSAAARPYYEKAARLASPGDTTINREAVERRIEELKSSQ